MISELNEKSSEEEIFTSMAIPATMYIGKSSHLGEVPPRSYRISFWDRRAGYGQSGLPDPIDEN